jgi:hypothetical protein
MVQFLGSITLCYPFPFATYWRMLHLHRHASCTLSVTRGLDPGAADSPPSWRCLTTISVMSSNTFYLPTKPVTSLTISSFTVFAAGLVKYHRRRCPRPRLVFWRACGEAECFAPVLSGDVAHGRPFVRCNRVAGSVRQQADSEGCFFRGGICRCAYSITVMHSAHS